MYLFIYLREHVNVGREVGGGAAEAQNLKWTLH